MDLDAIQAREAAHFLPVVKRFPVALASGSGSRVRDVRGPRVRRPDGGLGRHLHRPLAPGARARDRRAGRPPDADDQHLLHAAAARPLSIGSRSSRRAPITRTFLTNSGTEAVEGALKLAHRATGRSRFVSTRGSFHGRTLGALQVIGTAEAPRSVRAAAARAGARAVRRPRRGAARGRRRASPRSSSSRCRARAA